MNRFYQTYIPTWILLNHSSDMLPAFIFNFVFWRLICDIQAYCWVGWGLRSLNAAFPCWSYLSYFFYNLWSPFKIPFCLVPSVVFSFTRQPVYNLGTIRHSLWNSKKVAYIEGSIITAVSTQLQMFLNSQNSHNGYVSMLNCT
jgi:hypothetical protein